MSAVADPNSTGAGEGGGVEKNEGTPESNEQHGSKVVDVAGTSTGGVPVLSAKPVYGNRLQAG